MNHHIHRESSTEYRVSIIEYQESSIENPTLAHFRHFIPQGFSSLFTNLPAYKALYLRAYKAPDIYVPIRHYICREPSTNQPFLCKTNPILSAVRGLQMNVSNVKTMNYEKLDTWLSGKNKPNLVRPALFAKELPD